MSKKTLLLVEATTPEQKQAIKQAAPDYEILSFKEGHSLETLSSSKIEIIYGWDSTLTNLIKQTNQVKWIQTASAGIDYLPVSLLEEQRVRVTNVSGIHSVAIAESVFGMILYKTRGLLFSVNHQKKKEWGTLTRLTELKGQTMLIAGVGHIGKEVARLAKAFGMQTIGINRSGGKLPNIDELYTQNEYATQVSKADVIVNILPHTEKTDHVYDRAFFKKMKKEALFINVGRGASVNTNDLIKALQAGEFAYAGLDVFEEEPLPATSPLWEMENVLVTPHIAGQLNDYGASCFSIFHTNLVSYVADRDLVVNQVDLSKGY